MWELQLLYMSNRINFVLGAKKIISVNALYKAKLTYTPRGQVATIYKSKEAKMTEAYIKEQVELLDVPRNYPWITPDTLFKMTIKVIFRSGIFMRDLDNTIKLIQDGIFRALGVNDSHVVSIIANKVLFPGVLEEKILVCLEEVDTTGVRYDILPKPHIIWSEDIDLGLKLYPGKGARKSTFYQTDQEDEADTYVYLITPETFGYMVPVKVMEKVTECILESKGFVFIGFLPGTEDLSEFKSLICEHQKEYSGIKMKDLSNKEEILEWIKSITP